MTAIAITGMGLTGVLRITWVQDNLAHVLNHSRPTKPPAPGPAWPAPATAWPWAPTWTTRRCSTGRRGEIADLIWEAPDELAAEHAQVFQAAIRAYHAADPERADELWENVRAIWSQAWSANYAALEFMQGTGLTRFSPVKPQHWEAASFEHHCSPHGLPRPHIHNIALPVRQHRGERVLTLAAVRHGV